MSLTLSVKVQKGNCSAGLRVTVKVLNQCHLVKLFTN